jgi:hypothetical protein
MVRSARLVGAMAVVAVAGFSQAYKAPRTPDGKPNLNGIWQAMNEANWDLEGHAARLGMPVTQAGAWAGEPGSLGVVDGGTIPYLPAALEKKKQNFANRMKLDPEVKCYMPGIPRATYQGFPFQIIQGPQYTLMAYEFSGAMRTVYMKDPGPAPTDSWMGQSIAHWEGETLVVVSNSFNDQTWFDRAGNFHSDKLKVTERFTAMGPDALNYEATMEDPETFSKPWKISMPLYRRLEKNAQLLEYKCVEFVEELMYGHLRKKPVTK